MSKSVVQTSMHQLTGGVLVCRYYGFVAFCNFWLLVMRYLHTAYNVTYYTRESR